MAKVPGSSGGAAFTATATFRSYGARVFVAHVTINIPFLRSCVRLSQSHRSRAALSENHKQPNDQDYRNDARDPYDVHNHHAIFSRRWIVVIAIQHQRVYRRSDLVGGSFDQSQPHVSRRIIRSEE